MKNEEWRPVPFAPHVRVSSKGRVDDGKRISFGGKNSRGYCSKRINGKTHLIHRLVLLAFVGPTAMRYLMTCRRTNSSGPGGASSGGKPDEPATSEEEP